MSSKIKKRTNNKRRIKYHNDFFQNIFKDKKNLTDFLKLALPGDLKRYLSLENLEYVDTGYIKNSYKNSISDLVIKTRLKSERGDKSVYILLEHKSYPEPQERIFMQLLSYIEAIHEHTVKNRVPFHAVIPIIFYHGKTRWSIPTHFSEALAIPEVLRNYLLDFNYILFDTEREISLNKITHNPLLLSTVLAFKHSFEKNRLDILIKIVHLLNDSGLLADIGRVETLLRYLFYTKNICEEDFINIINNAGEKGEEIMVNIVDKYKMIGLKEGRREGRKEGLTEGLNKGIKKGKLEDAGAFLKEGISIDIIARCTGLPLETVQQIASSL